MRTNLKCILISLQANVQVLQLADVISGTGWLYGHVFPHQPNILLSRHYCDAVVDNSPPL